MNTSLLLLFLGLSLPLACLVPPQANAATPHKRQSAKPLVSNSVLLEQYLDDLQADPDDAALCKRIITLVRRMHSTTPVPDKVVELEGEAEAAMSGAKTQSDYNDAVSAFTQASVLAPWVPNVYFDLARAYEAAGEYSLAVSNYKLYLFASPHAHDKHAVELKIGADMERANQSSQEQ